VIPPRDLKRAVPGGGYIYHQSSIDRSKDADPLDADSGGKARPTAERAANLTVDGQSPGAIRLGGPSDAVEQAIAMSSEAGPAADESFEGYGGRLPDETVAKDDRAAPPQRGVARVEAFYRPLAVAPPACALSQTADCSSVSDFAFLPSCRWIGLPALSGDSGAVPPARSAKAFGRIRG
jgi:hypothetical protein